MNQLIASRPKKKKKKKNAISFNQRADTYSLIGIDTFRIKAKPKRWHNLESLLTEYDNQCVLALEINLINLYTTSAFPFVTESMHLEINLLYLQPDKEKKAFQCRQN